MKKTLTIILSVLLVLMLSVCAMAADSDFKHMPDYFAVGKYTNSGAAEVVIPAKLNGENTPVLYADSLGMNGLKGVTTLTISKGVTHIGDQNVMSGKELTKVSLPDTLEVIGRRNFYQMDALTEVTVPGNVAYVGSDCFSSCKALTKVTFKGVCPAFGNNVFKNASADLVVYVPSSQIDAYTAALPEGTNIQSSGKKVVASTLKVTEKDFAFDKETGAITGYTGKVGCFTIPAKIGGTPVKTIGKNAFFKNPFIAAVTIPEGVESIEQSAFAAPPMLSRVNFPSTLKTIGKGAFNGPKLDRLVLPEGLEIIGESAFHTAFGLNKPGEIIIPSTVTEIGAKAFHSHKAECFVIGENVQTVGNEAFAFANNMTEIVILNKNKIEIAGDAFSKTTTEATLTLPEGISKDVYQSYVDLMAIIYPTCTVLEPANMEMGFPALDVMAGMPFFGNWFSVAGMDVMGEFTDEYPVVSATLNPDGSANV
ncbi:MAG: leucine-rich repeat domain-containing protein, partial [Kiritimatiellae bacterium]|nr:leucine-rich repeat domain-containing protein [Kiritimatiellia bacterium]